MSSSPAASSPRLERALGVPQAVLLGLGSILGTGIFVSVGLGAEAAGTGVLAAIAIAAVVATCNGLSSAQLAAAFPVSGGTYEYGHRVLTPTLGFVAGWTFLCAKTASAATAALGFAGYVLAPFGVDAGAVRIAIAVMAAVVITAVVAGGIQRSARVNAVVVAITIVALLAFVVAGASTSAATDATHAGPTLPSLLRASALMFVAFTGYGRIATLGEEVRAPERAIPRAIVVTLAISAALYLAVAAAAIHGGGAAALAAATHGVAAPLATLARTWSPGVAWVVGIGAITAMLGVLLNLVLGLSRVVLAMARRGDFPQRLASVDERGSPRAAVIVVGLSIAALTLVGSVERTWSFSAFTVLVYYALTNVAALRLPPAQRRSPRAIAVLGLAACLALAFWVEPVAWIAGLAMIAVGLLWHAVARAMQARARPSA